MTVLERTLSNSIIALNNEIKCAMHLFIKNTNQTAEQVHASIEDMINGDVNWIPSVPTIYDYLRLFERAGIVESDNEEYLEKENRGEVHRLNQVKDTEFWLIGNSLVAPAFFTLECALNFGESMFNFFGTRNIDDDSNTMTRLDIMLALEEEGRLKPGEVTKIIGKPEVRVHNNLTVLREKGYLRRLGKTHELERFRVMRDLVDEFPRVSLRGSAVKGVYELHKSGFIQGATCTEITNELNSRGYKSRRDVTRELLMTMARQGHLDRIEKGKEFSYTSNNASDQYFDQVLRQTLTRYDAMIELAKSKLTPSGELRTFSRKELAEAAGVSKIVAGRYIRDWKNAGLVRNERIGYQRTNKGVLITQYISALHAYFGGKGDLNGAEQRLQCCSNTDLRNIISTALNHYTAVAPFQNATSMVVKQRLIVDYLAKHGEVSRSKLIKEVGTGDFDAVATLLMSSGTMSSQRKGKNAYYSLNCKH